MPLCVKCGTPLVCTACHAEQRVGAVDKACALKKGAVWIHVMDDQGQGVEGVSVALDGGPIETDKSGFAAFDPKDAGTYQVSLVPLGVDLARRYDPPRETEGPVRVSDGEITYLAFTLTRRATLKVQVAQKNNHARVFSGATVTLVGKGDKPSGGDGIADFKDQSPGQYTVKVKLGAEDAKKFCAPDPLELTVAPGQVKPVVYEVEEIHVVKPIVTPESAIGWHDGASAEHCVAATLRLGIQETPSPSRYRGRGHVEVAAGEISLFEDKECLRPATSFSAEALRARDGQPLYVKGKSAGKGQVKLRLEAAEDPVRVTVEDPATEAVEIKPVNVVTPVIEPEHDAVLVDKGLSAHQAGGEDKVRTSATRVEVSLTETLKEQPFNKGAFLTSSSGDLEIYEDPECTTAHDQRKAIPYGELTDSVKKKKLYLRGKAAGEATLTLRPEGGAGPGIRVIEKAEKSVIAVKLDLEVHAHAEAKPHAEAALTDIVKVTPGRALHEQDGVPNFGRAKLVVKKPDAKLWSVGGADSKVVVSVTVDTGAVGLFTADAGGAGAQKKELAQGDFVGGDVSLWVEGTTAGKKLRHARVDVGIQRDGGELKRNGDWGRFTVVKIAKVTPDVANYKQKVNEAGSPEKGPKYKAKASLSEKLQGVRLCFRVVAHEDNAFTLPEIWKHKNPDAPVHGLTDVNGVAEGEVELSGVDPNYKSGYDTNKFLVAAYVSGELIADDPKRTDASPKRRVESQQIEIDAPALPCPCCGQDPGHTVGYPMSQDAWYRTVDFKAPPTASAEVVAYNGVIVDVGRRTTDPPCSCNGAGIATRVVPTGPCNRFFRPLTAAEKATIESKWDHARKKWQARLGIVPTDVVRQVNHLVPKSGGGCPNGVYNGVTKVIVRSNLEAHKKLCPFCQGIDGVFTGMQNRLPRILK